MQKISATFILSLVFLGAASSQGNQLPQCVDVTPPGGSAEPLAKLSLAALLDGPQFIGLVDAKRLESNSEVFDLDRPSNTQLTLLKLRSIPEKYQSLLWREAAAKADISTLTPVTTPHQFKKVTTQLEDIFAKQPDHPLLPNRLAPIFPYDYFVRNQTLVAARPLQPNVIVAGDTADIKGGFKGAKPGSWVIVEYGTDGKPRCNRPQTSADLKVADQTGKTNKLGIKLEGFSEIALIAHQPGQTTAAETVCSAVLIGKNLNDSGELYVVTAGHCMVESQSNFVPFSAQELAENYRVLLPKNYDEGAPRSVPDCFTQSGLQTCGYWVGAITSQAKFPKEMFGTPNGESTRTVVPDIALLTVKFPLAERRFATLPLEKKFMASLSKGDTDFNLVQGGFGYSNGEQKGKLVVGAWIGRPSVQINGFLKLKHSQPEMFASKACHFDSGGPVFWGPQNGEETEPRTLMGLISGAANATTAKDCKRYSDYEIVQVITPDVHKWLCQQTANGAKGCPPIEP